MKMTKKSPWARILAVASAAVCTVTATAVGVNFPMTKADAADATYVAYLHVEDSYWAVNTYSNAFDNSVKLNGDGSYSITVANSQTWGAGEWEQFRLVLFEPQGEDLYTTENLTIDSVVIGSETYENVEFTIAGGQYSRDSEDNYLYSAVATITTTDFATLGAGETVTVNFTIGEGGDVTTTETTETTTETTETTTETTETTTETTETTETTTVTSVTEDTETSETETSETETTTTTTETTETTTTTTTTQTTTTPNYDKEITDLTKQTEEGDDGNINAFVEFDPAGADSATLVYKVLSDDTNTSGAFGTWNGSKWLQVDWTEIAVPASKEVSVDYTIPSDVGDIVKASVYWPGQANVQFVKVILHYDEDPDATQSTTEFESDLTFTSVKVDADNKINILDRCYVVATVKGPAGYTMTGGMYSGDLADEWEVTLDSNGLATVEYEIRDEAEANFKVFYCGKGTAKETSVEVNITTYYEGDASLNGKVNGSDVLAILKYLKATEKTDLQDAVCDINVDDKVTMVDAVTLMKSLLSPSTVASLMV